MLPMPQQRGIARDDWRANRATDRGFQRSHRDRNTPFLACHRDSDHIPHYNLTSNGCSPSRVKCVTKREPDLRKVIHCPPDSLTMRRPNDSMRAEPWLSGPRYNLTPF